MDEAYRLAMQEQVAQLKEELSEIEKMLDSNGHLSMLAYRAAERNLQLLIEACIGIAKQTLKAQGCQSPTDARQVFAKLKAKGMDPTDTPWPQVIGMRNALVHDYLNFDPEVLEESGSSRSERQMRSSLIMMTLWRECTGIEEVRSPDLKDAVRISGVDDNGLFNMYQFNNGEGDRYFRRDSSGANTDISLTLPGKREGYDQIQRTIERLEGGWEADE